MPIPEEIFFALDHDGQTDFAINSISGTQYYFLDRFAEKYPEYKLKDIDINSRPAYNYTFILADPENLRLYVYQLDT